MRQEACLRLVVRERIIAMSYSAAVITISDKGSRGERVDTSGPAVCKMLADEGFEVVHTNIVPDEMDIIKSELLKCADELKISLVLTTGGTGFSPRDITPEATLAVVERETRGIPELMRAVSLKITPRGCLSRSVAGIRKGTLIINLPGSEKAAKENLEAVLGSVKHGLEMLASAGSADCAGSSDNAGKTECVVGGVVLSDKKNVPSMDAWLKEAKKDPDAGKVGIYLTHNGIVRETAKAMARDGEQDTKPVVGMLFSYDKEKVDAAIEKTRQLEGIYYVRVWLNEGSLQVGDDIMYVLIGGDIRSHVVEALNSLVGKLKAECVSETELF